MDSSRDLTGRRELSQSNYAPPNYQTVSSRYCRLLFGGENPVGSWLIVDGATAIVERAGQQAIHARHVCSDHPDWREGWLGEVHELDGASRFRDLRLRVTTGLAVLSVCSDAWGLRDCTAVVEYLTLADCPAQAGIVHFNGPLVLQCSVEQRGRTATLIARVGTPGIGVGTFASITASLAQQVLARPVAVLQFTDRNGNSRHERMELGFDC